VSSKLLVILGHPVTDSLCGAIAGAVAGAADPARWEVKRLNLGDLEFDPVLRYGYRRRMEPDPAVTQSQELVRWADRIVLIFPVWWSTVPGLLKGWFDRVLAPGVTYHVEGKHGMVGHLKSTVDVVIVSHAPAWLFRLGRDLPGALAKVVWRQNGAKIGHIHRLGNVKASFEAARRPKWEAFIQRLTAHYAKL
jgi:putative NADPH-quinone reductase